MGLNADISSVFYGKTQVLQGVSFEASAGQVTAIVGPNGSGKTTLLKAVTGEQAYQGSVTLNGADCAQKSPQELAMIRAVLPQASGLAFPFTVLEVVRLGLTAGLATRQPDSSNRLPLATLARVGLAGFEGRFFQELSGGEKQRVQLARVLVQIWDPVLNGAPRWLFLDEPVSALDIGHQLVVIQIAQDYARAGGGVVAVMHDLNLTAMFADKIALMKAGQILAAGQPETVLTDAHLSTAYGCDIRMNTAPPDGGQWLLPQMSSLPGREAAE